jgi:hypothetical protein
MTEIKTKQMLTYSEEILTKLTNELDPVFDQETSNINEFERILVNSEDDLRKLKLESKIFLSTINKTLKKEIRQLLEKISIWVQKNFSHAKLNSVIMLISNILSVIGCRIEIEREEIIKLLQLETYDQLMLSEKEEKSKNEEILSKDSIITNIFLSSFYSLIATIANKSEVIFKSKNLLRAVVTVLTQICLIDKIAIYFKKKRILSLIAKIIKILHPPNKDSDHISIEIAKVSICLFSKIGMKREIYRDYMFKKAIPDIITDIFLLNYTKDFENFELCKIFSAYTFFATRIVDHKTFFWSKGVLPILIGILNKLLAETNTNRHEEIEYITLSIYNLAIDNYEIQSELIDLDFLVIAKEILIKFSNQNFILFNVLSTLRRIRDEEYLEKITEELLYTFFALFDYFYIKTKTSFEEKLEKTEIAEKHEESSESRKEFFLDDRFEFIILKELVAILGNIVKDVRHSKPFIDKNLHLVLIDITLSFTAFPKLIKNTIGALINLTNNEEIRDEISRAAPFIKSIYVILDKYKENSAIIDYELKLLVNVSKNEFLIKTFISGDMFYYLILIMKNYCDHDEIVSNVIKIIRILVLKSKLRF